MKAVLPYLKAFFLLLAAYFVFAVGAYLVPQGTVDDHIVNSLNCGDLASDQPRAFLPRLQCRMDNFTDALILNQAHTMRSMSLIDGIMQMPRQTYHKLPFEELRIAMGVDGMPDGAQADMTTYARYWHGNTFLARYLLLFFDYPTIRLLLYVLSSLLLLWCCLSLWRRGGWQVALAVGMGLFCCYVFMMQFSLQLAMVLFIALGGTIAVAKNRCVGITLFVVGSLTAYFDLLTAPVLTLGLPLVTAVALGGEKIRMTFRRLTEGSLLWALGYGLTWVFKWLLATLLTSENILVDGVRNVAHRSSDIAEFTRMDAVAANLELLPWNFIRVAMVAIMVLACIHFRMQGWRVALPLLAVAVLPLLWYFFAANHSYWHNWFTFRALAVSVAALLLAACAMVDWNKFKSK